MSDKPLKMIDKYFTIDFLTQNASHKTSELVMKQAWRLVKAEINSTKKDEL